MKWLLSALALNNWRWVKKHPKGLKIYKVTGVCRSAEEGSSKTCVGTLGRCSSDWRVRRVKQKYAFSSLFDWAGINWCLFSIKIVYVLLFNKILWNMCWYISCRECYINNSWILYMNALYVVNATWTLYVFTVHVLLKITKVVVLLSFCVVTLCLSCYFCVYVSFLKNFN